MTELYWSERQMYDLAMRCVDEPGDTGLLAKEMLRALGRLDSCRRRARQADAVVECIERVVPKRYAGMHPLLEDLFGMAQSWRNYIDVTEAKALAPNTVCDNNGDA